MTFGIFSDFPFLNYFYYAIVLFIAIIFKSQITLPSFDDPGVYVGFNEV